MSEYVFELHDTVRFYGDTHRVGDRMQLRTGIVVGRRLLDGTDEHVQLPGSIDGYTGGHCWDHRLYTLPDGTTRTAAEAEVERTNYLPMVTVSATMNTYTIRAGRHEFGVCECRLIIPASIQLELF